MEALAEIAQEPYVLSEAERAILEPALAEAKRGESLIDDEDLDDLVDRLGARRSNGFSAPPVIFGASAIISCRRPARRPPSVCVPRCDRARGALRFTPSARQADR